MEDMESIISTTWDEPEIPEIPSQEVRPHTDLDDDMIGAYGDPTVSVQDLGKPKRLIIVEPVLALFFASYIPSNTLVSQFVYAVVSSRNNLTKALDSLGELNGSLACVEYDESKYNPIYDLQQSVQSKSANLMIVLEVSCGLPAIIMVLFYGAYSDKIGRKLPLVAPLIGQLIKCVVYVVVIRFHLPFEWLLVGNIAEGISGGMTTMMMACFAYLADICDRTKRSIRITAIEVTCGISAGLAQIAMGVAIKYMGYMWPFLFVLGVHFINMCYVLMFVPELRRSKNKDTVVSKQHMTRAIELYTTKSDDDSASLKKRWLLLMAIICCDVTVAGRWDPLTLFSLNSPLCWSSVIIGGYAAWTSLCAQFGGIGLVALFHSKLQDTGLAIVGCVSGAVYFLLVAFCDSTWSMFLVGPIGLASFIPVTMLRSISSKLTPSDEQGALFSSLAAVDTICMLAGSVIFNPIYGATLMFMKGFVFIVMAILEVLGLMIIITYALKYGTSQPNISPVNEGTLGNGYESIN